MSVLAVTVAYNSSGILDDFLTSLEIGTTHDHEVVIVDNNSSDIAAVRSIAARHAPVRLLEQTENLGYGRGMNAGVEFAQMHADYVLITNPDVKFMPGSIDALIEAAESTPGGGAFGPAILNADGTVYPSARELPSLRTGIAHALLGRAWPNNPWTRKYKVTVSTSEGQRVAGWLSGACLLIRAEVFHKLGGFDTSYFMYFEDVDLGARLADEGWTNVYVPGSRVLHTGAHSTSQAPTSMELAHHTSAYRYLARRYSAPHLAPLRAVLRLGLRLRWLLLKR